MESRGSYGVRVDPPKRFCRTFWGSATSCGGQIPWPPVKYSLAGTRLPFAPSPNKLLKSMPMKLRISHCAFALLPLQPLQPLQTLTCFMMYIWWGILIACAVAWISIHCYSLFHYLFFFFFLFTLFFLGNAVLKLYTHAHFHLVYCIFAIVTVCHFLSSLIAFDCQEIKRLLTYLLTYLQDFVPNSYREVRKPWPKSFCQRMVNV